MRLFNWPFYRTQDDRGQTIRISMHRWRDTHPLEHSQKTDDPALTELISRINNYNTSSVWDIHLSVADVFSLGIIPISCIILAYILASIGWIPTPWNSIFFPIGIASSSILYTQRRFRQLGPTVISTMLAEGRCPVCAYVIAGSAEHPNGCLVCPECSSAWKHDRVRLSDLNAHIPAPSRLRYIHPGTRLERWMKYMNRRNAHDARNRVVILIHPFLVGLHPQTYAELGSERIQQARQALRQVTRTRRWFLTGLFLFPSLTMSLLFFSRIRTVAGSGGFTTLDFYLLLWLVGLFFSTVAALKSYFGYMDVNTQLATAELIAHNICPSCAADLAQLSNDEDGCVECDSCGCYWRRFATTTSPAHRPLPAQSAE